MLLNLLTAFFFLLGSLLILIAAIGIIRMPDLYTQMHAATKAPTLGILFIMLGVGIYFHLLSIWGTISIIILFTFITAPVASHLLAKNAYSQGEPFFNPSQRDDYKHYLNSKNKS